MNKLIKTINNSNEEPREEANKYISPVEQKYKVISTETKFLDKDIEVELVKRAKDGCILSKGKIISSYLKLVICIAKKYYSSAQNSSISIDDLIQSGIEGLEIAINEFDNQRNKKFCVAARIWVKNKIVEFYRCNLRQFSISHIGSHRIYLLNKAKNELKDELNREPTNGELSARLKKSRYWNKERSLDWIEEYGKFLQPGVSFDMEVANAQISDIKTFKDLVPDDHVDSPATTTMIMDDIYCLRKYIDKLPVKQQSVIKYRYIEGLKLHEVAKKLNLTPQRINQLESAGFKYLKEKLLKVSL